jgi:hypothetical protein
MGEAVGDAVRRRVSVDAFARCRFHNARMYEAAEQHQGNESERKRHSGPWHPIVLPFK